MPRPAITLFALPLLILALGTVFFRVFPWDVDWLSSFYDPQSAAWIYADSQPWSALYDFGYYPAWIVAITSLIVFLAGFWFPRLRDFRKLALFLVLVLAIGPGIIVNAVFKDHWGRPRPREIESFGGPYAFEKVFAIDPTSPGRSFPSGHASMGFYFVVFAFCFASLEKKLWAVAAGALGFLYGLLMGVGRMIQGGHFPSDVLWSAGFVFLTAAALYYILGLHSDPYSRQETSDLSPESSDL